MFRVCMKYFINETDIEPFTGEVEIDESSFKKKSKYQRGRRYKNNWVFGITSRGTKKSRFFCVPDRKRETLLRIILANIEEGSTIYSDAFKSYNCLGNYGYHHLVVNHSEEFVCEANREVHTQNIEGRWAHVKRFTKQDGPNKLEHLQERLDEYTFRCAYMQDMGVNTHILGRLVGKFGMQAKEYLKHRSSSFGAYFA